MGKVIKLAGLLVVLASTLAVVGCGGGGMDVESPSDDAQELSQMKVGAETTQATTSYAEYAT